MEVLYYHHDEDTADSAKTTIQCDAVEEGEKGLFLKKKSEEGNRTTYRQIAYIQYKKFVQAIPEKDN